MEFPAAALHTRLALQCFLRRLFCGQDENDQHQAGDKLSRLMFALRWAFQGTLLFVASFALVSDAMLYFVAVFVLHCVMCMLIWRSSALRVAWAFLLPIVHMAVIGLAFPYLNPFGSGPWGCDVCPRMMLICAYLSVLTVSVCL